MHRSQRLQRTRDFSTVYGRGKSWSNQLLALRALPNGLPQSRFGFAVGKRVGNAVTRNRVKRRLREAARLLGPAGGWDVVVVARPPAATADWPELRAGLSSLLRRAGLLAADGLAEGTGGRAPTAPPERAMPRDARGEIAKDG